MSGDIKEIVNNLNKANSKKDSDDDVSTYNQNYTNINKTITLKIYLYNDCFNFGFSWILFVEY